MKKDSIKIIKKLKEENKLKISEIFTLIDNGDLHYDQTTQRKFIYQDMKVPTEDGPVTKAGNVIRSILKFDVQLPAVYFWEQSDGTFNIHDGKQRILSLYYFCHPEKEIPVMTRINGPEDSFTGLKPEIQEKLLNYELYITTKKGPSSKEEESFYVINSNAVPLTDYENLRGMFHGKWIYGFEEFIEQQANILDAVKKIDRGEQAIYFLLSCFEFKFKGDKGSLYLLLKDRLKDIRNKKFDAKNYKLNEVVACFGKLRKILKNSKAKDETLISVAKFIIKKGWDKEKIYEYYQTISSNANDIGRWPIETHVLAITKLIQDKIECDGRRFFTNKEKADLFERVHHCQHENCSENNFDKLEVDHKTPWSKGGKTSLSNAQLLCKSHNASKRDKDELDVDITW